MNILVFGVSQYAFAGGPLPVGPRVVQGRASVAIRGNAMNITQHSQNVFINFDSFNIGVDNAVNYLQPSNTSVAVNKIVGSSPSEIFGALNANGIVYLLNPNGILFGETAQVNVGGLFAGAYNEFKEGSDGAFFLDGANADVVNKGNIAADSFVTLAGKNVVNEGNISASSVNLLSSKGIELPNIAGGEFILKVDDSHDTPTGLAEVSGSVINDGMINVVAAGDEGNVQIRGETVRHNGDIEAFGGTIEIIGTEELFMAGDINAPDAFVETSAPYLNITGSSVLADSWLIDPENVDIDTADPGAGNTFLDVATITGALDGGTDVTVDTDWSTGTTPPALGADPGQPGNIRVLTAVSSAGSGDLTLLADNNISISDDITIDGDLTLTSGLTTNGLISDTAAVTLSSASGAVDINAGTSVTLNAGTAVSAGTNVTIDGGSAGGAAGADTLTLGTVTANAGNVVIGGTDPDPNVTAAGTITATGGYVAIDGYNIQTAAINADTNNAGNAIKLTGGNNVTVGGTLTASGAATDLGIDIDPVNVNINSDMLATGAINVTASNDINVAGGVTVQADTDSSGAEALTITADDDNGGGGDLLANTTSTLQGASVNLDGDNVTTGTVTADSGDATITASSAITLTNTTSASGAGADLIIDSDTPGGTNVNINADLDAGQDVNIDAGNSIAHNSGDITAGRDVMLDAANTITVGGTIGNATAVGRNIAIEQFSAVNSAVNINGAIAADDAVRIDATNLTLAANVLSDVEGGVENDDIDIATTGWVNQTGGYLDANTGGLRIDATGDVTLLDLRTTGNNQVPAQGSLPPGQVAVHVSGDNVTMSASATANITSTGGDVEVVADTGDIDSRDINATGHNVYLEAGNDIDILEDVTTPTNFTADAGNALSVNGEINISGDASLLAGTGALTQSDSIIANDVELTGATITLNDASNSFSTVRFNSAGAVQITEVNATQITSTNTALSLDLNSGGAITSDATNIGVTNNADFADAGGAGITINTGTVNFGSLTFNSTGAVVIDEDSAMVLAGASTAGSLLLNSGGTIGQSGALSVNTTTTVDATGNDITLDNTGNALTGTVTIKNGGGTTNADITNTLATDLATMNVKTLDVESGGNLTQSGILTVSGSSTLDAGGNTVTLDLDNSFGGLTVSGGVVNFTGSQSTTNNGDITVTNSGLLTVSSDVSLNGSGDFLQNDTGGVALNADISSASGTVEFDGDVVSADGVTLTGAAVQFDGRLSIVDDDTAGTLNVDGDLTFGSGSTWYVTLDGKNAGSKYDQIVLSNGDLTFNAGADLDGDVGFNYKVGNEVTLVDNGSGNSTTGTFVDGTSVTLTGQAFDIDYNYAPGNDLVLTRGLTEWVWDGGSATTDAWSDAANWTNDSGNPEDGDAVVFAGSTRLTPDNDLLNLSLNSITFDNTAGAFTLGGNAISLSGGVTNDSSSLKTVSMNITLTSDQAFNASSGDLVFNGTVDGPHTLTVSGDNDVTFNAAVGGTTPLSGLTGTGTGALTVTSALLKTDGAINIARALNWQTTGSLISGTGSLTTDATTLADGVVLTLQDGASGAIDIGSVSGVAGGASSDLVINTTGTAQVGTVGTDIGTVTVVDSAGTTFTGTVDADTLDLQDTADGASIAFQGDTTVNTLTTAAEGYVFEFDEDLTVTNDANFAAVTAAGGLTIGDADDDVATFTGGVDTTAVAGTVTLAGTLRTAGQQMDFGAVTLADDTTLDTTSNGAVPAGAVLNIGQVSGAAHSLSVDVGSQDISLTNAANTFGTLSLTGTNATVVELSATDLGTTSLGGTLEITSSGAVTQSGAVDAGATTILAAGQNVTLTNTSNTFGDLTVQGATVQITEDEAITDGSAWTTTGTTTLNANGGASDITLDQDNSFGGLTVTGGAVNFTGSQSTTNNGGITVTNSGLLTVSSDVSLNGSGGFLQNGTGGVALNADISSTTGAIEFDGDVVSADAVTLTGAAVQFDGRLSIVDDDTAGTLNVDGDLTFGSGSTWYVTLDGKNAGSKYDQIVLSNGDLTFNAGADLDGDVGFNYKVGNEVTLVDNGSGNAVTGQFTDGTSTTLTGQVFDINYNYAPGNDLVLTRGLTEWVWDGGGADDNWTTAANWTNDSGNPEDGDAVVFAGSTRLAPDNDLLNLSLNSITFNDTAGAFTLGGNAISLSGGVTNDSSSLNTVSMNITLTGDQAFNASSGDLAFNGTIKGAYTLTVSGDNDVTFNGLVGDGTPLAGLTGTGTGALTVGSALLRTDGAINIARALNWQTTGSLISGTGSLTTDAITLADGVVLTLQDGASGAIDIGSVSGVAGGASSDLVINTTGTVQIGTTGNDIGTVTVANSAGTTFTSTVDADTLNLQDTDDGASIAFQGDTTVNTLTTAAEGYVLEFDEDLRVVDNVDFAAITDTGGLNIGDGSDDIATFTGGVDTTAVKGTVTLAGAVRTPGQQMDFGAVTLVADTTLDSTNAGWLPNGANINLAQVTGGNNALTVDVGSSATLSGSSAIAAANVSVTGNATFGNTVTATSGDLTVTGTSDVSADLTADNNVKLDGDVTLSSSITMNAKKLIDLGGNVDGDYDLTLTSGSGSDVENTIGTTVNNLTVTGAKLTAGVIDIDGSLDADVDVETDNGVVDVAGNVDAEGTLLAETGVNIGGSAEFGDNVTAETNDIHVVGDVTLSGDVVLDAANQVDLDAGVDGNYDLTLTSGSGSDVENTIGTTINNLTVTGAKLTAGIIDIDGDLDADADVETDNGVVDVAGNVDAEGTLVAETGVNIGGSAEFGDNVTAETSDIQIGDAVVLTNDVVFSGQDVTFDSTIDSDAGNRRAMTVNTNSNGVTTFNGVIGGNDRLASLTTNADGRVDINTTGINTDGASVIFNEAVLLGADLTIDEVGTGNVEFASTVDSEAGSNYSLTVNTGSGATIFSDAVGSDALGALSDDNGLGAVSTDADGSTQINGGVVTTTGDQTYADSVTLGGDTTLSGTNIEFSGTLDDDTNALTGSELLVNASGNTNLFGSVGNTTALDSLTTDGPGTTNFDTNVVKAAELDFNDDVVTQQTTTLTGTTSVDFGDTLSIGDGAGEALTVAGATVGFNGAVDSADGNDLTVNATTTNLNAQVGSGSALGTLTTDGVGTTYVNTDVVSADMLDFNDDVVTQQTTTLTGTTSVDFGDTLSVGDGAGEALTVAGATVGFNGAVDSADGNDLTVNATTTNLNAQVGSGSALGTLTTDGVGTTYVNTDVVSADMLDFNDDVVTQQTTTLTGTTSVDFGDTLSVGDGAGEALTVAGATVGFNGAVDSADGNDLTVNATTTNLNAQVGSGSALGTLTTDGVGTTYVNTDVVSADMLDFNDDVVTQQTTTLTGTTSVDFGDTLSVGDGAGEALTVAGATVGFNGAVDSADGNDLTVNATTTNLNAQVGSGSALGTLTTDGVGTTYVNTDVVTADMLDFNDDMVTQQATTLTGTTSVDFGDTLSVGANTTVAGQDVTFGGTVDGSNALVVNASGTTTFDAAVGANTPLSSLTTNAGGNTQVNGGAITTTNGQNFNDTVTFNANTTLVSGTGALNGTSFIVSNGILLTLQDGVATGATNISSVSGVAGGNVSNLTINSAGPVAIGTVGTDVGTVRIANSTGTTFTGNVDVDTVDIRLTNGTVAFDGDLIVNNFSTAYLASFGVQLNGLTTTITNPVTFYNTGGVQLGNSAYDTLAFNGGVTVQFSNYNLGGTLYTPGLPVSFATAGTLVSDAVVDTTYGGVYSGASIYLSNMTGNSSLQLQSGTSDIQLAGAISTPGTVSISTEGDVYGAGSIDAGTLRLTLDGGTFSSNRAGGAFDITGTNSVYIGASSPEFALAAEDNGIWSITRSTGSSPEFFSDGVILGLVLHNNSMQFAPVDISTEFARQNAFLSLVRQMKSRNGVFDPAYFIHSYMSLRDVVALGLIDFLNFGSAVVIVEDEDRWNLEIEEEIGDMASQFRAR